MNRSESKPARRRRTCVISFLLLIGVFFLPLHYHPLNAAAQITKDCACVHGSRTESGLASASAISAPLFAAQAVVADIYYCTGYVLVLSGHIRAPPIAASL